MMLMMQLSQGSQLFSDPETGVLDRERSKITVEEVAHGLSQICRFGGNTREFYSVAQHSNVTAGITQMLGGSPQELLAALLHDAHEMITSDVPTPVKKMVGEAWTRVEDDIQDWVLTEISRQLGFPRVEITELVKKADHYAMLLEGTRLVQILFEEQVPTELLMGPAWSYSPETAKRCWLSMLEAVVQACNESLPTD
jgi:hypothetical protein